MWDVGMLFILFFIWCKSDLFCLLMTCFDALNPTTKTCTTTIDGSRDIIEKKNIYGVGTSFFLNSYKLIVGELHLFKSLFLTFIFFIDFFAWWHENDDQFPNVGAFAK